MYIVFKDHSIHLLSFLYIFFYVFTVFTFLPEGAGGEVPGNTSFSSVRSKYEIVNLSFNLALDSLKAMVFRITLL